MLKNELEILATIQSPQFTARQIAPASNAGFSDHLTSSCSRIREKWTAATFSGESEPSIRRYFDFHFKFLSGLILENNPNPQGGLFDELCRLMDHLLYFYGAFIDQQQIAPRQYCAYRLKLNESRYKDALEQLRESSISDAFKNCLEECLSPLYHEQPAGDPILGTMFYRERLISELTGILGKRQSTDEHLIMTLITLNFNHLRFVDFLRERTILKICSLPLAEQEKYILELSLSIPAGNGLTTLCFDSNWPHIGTMYKGWLNEYRELRSVAGRATGSGELPFAKIPLNISVKHLACMIRALYTSGFYGNVSLSAIFDHAAAVFVTKRQDRISADSLSNAYYGTEQSSAAKTIAIFDGASRALRSCYFPG